MDERTIGPLTSDIKKVKTSP